MNGVSKRGREENPLVPALLFPPGAVPRCVGLSQDHEVWFGLQSSVGFMSANLA